MEKGLRHLYSTSSSSFSIKLDFDKIFLEKHLCYNMATRQIKIPVWWSYISRTVNTATTEPVDLSLIPCRVKPKTVK